MPARIQSLPTAPRRNVRAMNGTDAHRPPAIEWCVASRAAPEEAESGDLHLVSQWEGGALLAVIDGLGHGSQARVATRQAAEVLRFSTTVARFRCRRRTMAPADSPLGCSACRNACDSWMASSRSSPFQSEEPLSVSRFPFHRWRWKTASPGEAAHSASN